MPPAARIGDATAHPGMVAGPGISTVLIAGRPAAVMGDTHVCGRPRHPATVIVRGSTTVRIGGRAAARVGDISGCGSRIIQGARSVNIGG